MNRIPSSKALLVLGALALSACSGGGARVQSQNITNTTTMGQELLDLDKSYKEGIITRSEYEKAKKAILKRYSK